MAFETPFGDISCDSVSWNLRFTPKLDQLQWICRFKENWGPTETGGKPHVLEDNYYAEMRSASDIVVHLPGIELEYGTPHCFARYDFTTAIAEILLLDKACEVEPWYTTLSRISVHALLLYANNGHVGKTIRKSFPRLEAAINQSTADGGHVYLLSDHQGHYKIGKAKNVDKRICQLKTQPPFKLKIITSTWFPKPFDEEKRLHERFKEFRINGEWFALPDKQLVELETDLLDAECAHFRIENIWNYIAEGADVERCLETIAAWFGEAKDGPTSDSVKPVARLRGWSALTFSGMLSDLENRITENLQQEQAEISKPSEVPDVV